MFTHKIGSNNFIYNHFFPYEPHWLTVGDDFHFADVDFVWLGLEKQMGLLAFLDSWNRLLEYG